MVVSLLGVAVAIPARCLIFRDVIGWGSLVVLDGGLDGGFLAIPVLHKVERIVLIILDGDHDMESLRSAHAITALPLCSKDPNGERQPADVVGAAAMVGRIATGEIGEKPAKRPSKKAWPPVKRAKKVAAR